MERVLRSLPAAEPPAFFETRLKAAVLADERMPASSWRPVLAPLAALLVAATAVFIVSRQPGRDGPVSQKPVEIIVPGEAPEEPPRTIPAPLAAEPTVIYPVWPGDGDVVSGDDLSIMASLYPAPRPGAEVSMTLNDRDVSDRIIADGELVSFIPGKIEPGRHVITITLREAGGDKRSVTFSFFALEGQS
ncbi:MAG TPA: hypothetical protein DDW31_00565 [candidate division Zixibacteria bacterium]|nr:hypothetical protein [candidate division Zixibacteria bacterium]